MIVQKQANGELVLMGQTDHSRLVGQFAAHWGNGDFATPKPYESVVRAAVYHDYGWLSYETSPLIDPESGEPYEFRTLPFNSGQVDAYQSCIDWLKGIDRYSALIVSMHRTGLWQGRYQKIKHPSARYNPKTTGSEIESFIKRNEVWQEQERRLLDQNEVWTNYWLQQVWDLLGLYFTCQEPYDDYIEPVPVSYGSNKTVRLILKPVGGRKVAFEPYPFDVHPFHVQVSCKRLPAISFPDLPTFRKSYFQAKNETLHHEIV